MTSKSELKRLAFQSPAELADKYHDLQTQLAESQARVEELEKENEELLDALNLISSPRRWSQSMIKAWHSAIPDTTEAFKKLVNEALNRGLSDG